MTQYTKIAIGFLTLLGSNSTNSANSSFRVVTANVNLMPQSLNIATTGNPEERAFQIAESLLNSHPNTDVYVLQELYDTAASTVLIKKLKSYGYDYYPGPNNEQLQAYWEKTGQHRWVSAKNSGQGIFIKNNSGLRIESYDVLSFVESGVEGIGILESYVPKGVIHLKIASEKGNQAISLFGYHLQAQIGLFAFTYWLQGKWKQLPETLLSDCIHLQPSQNLRIKYPTYHETIRTRQIAATKEWIHQLEKSNKIADQRLHIGDFNLVAGSPEYERLLETMNVVSARDTLDLITIGNPHNTTWSKWLRPLYIALCKYLGSYGWIDLTLVSHELKSKVVKVFVVDLQNQDGKSITDHESVAVLFHDIFET